MTSENFFLYLSLLISFQAEHGYKNLVGVDYSEGAMQLASSIAESKQVNIKYQVC